MQTFKNGGIAWKQRKLYTNVVKYALILLFLKMSLAFGNFWDLLRYVLSPTCLEI